MCTTRFKHLGFKEENEVRIVAAPTKQTPELMQHYSKNGIVPNPQKQIQFRTRNRRPVPFIKLFGIEGMQLPIEKIIVGPSENKESVSAAIRKMISDTSIEVAISDIPYV